MLQYRINVIKLETDKWIHNHLSVFSFFDDSVIKDFDFYVKINSELIFNYIFNNDKNLYIEKEINSFIDFVIKDFGVFNDVKYTQTHKLIELYRKIFQSSDYHFNILLETFNPYTDLAHLELSCYDGLLTKNFNPNINKIFSATRVAENILKEVPDIIDAYFLTHSIFYITYLGNDESFKSYPFYDDLCNHTLTILSLSLFSDNYDLTSELLLCIFLLDIDIKHYMHIINESLDRLIHYLEITASKIDNFTEDYHTVLVLNMLSHYILKKRLL